MPPYDIYKASGWTHRGSVRDYLGHTRCMSIRTYFHKQSHRPRWLAACDVEQALRYDILEQGLASKEIALVAEAFHAARAIVQNMATTRGGPWSSPRPLSASQICEIKEAAKLRCARKLFELAAKNKRCSLHKHLCGLHFESDPSSEMTYRGAEIVRLTTKTSGTNGNVCRKRRIADGTLKAGSIKHKRSHRGRNFKKRRVQETTNRKYNKP